MSATPGCSRPASGSAITYAIYLTTQRFALAPPFPFTRCDPTICVYATRMPLLPLLYAGLAKLVGTKSAAVAIARCTLTAAMLTLFLVSLARDARFSFGSVLLAYGLYLGPQVLKHGASFDYEEGLMVDLEICLAIATVYLINPRLSGVYSKRRRMALAAALLATSLYFIKTTALPLLVVVLALILLDRQLTRQLKAVACCCVLVPGVMWAAHTYGSSGSLHFSSSWNGENFYRGSNSEALALYPEVMLDRLFDSTRASLADGRVVQLHDLKSQRCFVDEWSWNDYYRDLARSWWQQHPAEAWRFFVRKVWVAFFELRHTPYRVAAEGSDSEYGPLVSAAMLAWMAVARLTLFAMLGCVVRDLLRGQVRQPLSSLAFIAAGWAPYVVVFVYQRHVVPLLVMGGFLLAGLYLCEPRGRQQVIAPTDIKQ
jgi:hypothetical protein